MKRSGKFYRRNEAEVMESFGLKPTKNSGSGWIEKEDGQSENVICQLKSTDANSIKVNKRDLDTLAHNALVSHKLPVFVIQFLESNEVYLVIKPEKLDDISRYLETGKAKVNDAFEIDLSEYKESTTKQSTKIKSSYDARNEFNIENEKQFEKKWRKAK